MTFFGGCMTLNPDLNYEAIFVCSIIYLLLGALWYSPILFGKQWISLTGLQEKDMKGSVRAYIGGFFVALYISVVLSMFIYKTQALTALEGALVGFWAWFGFIATTHFSGVIWEKKPFNLYLIHVVFLLIMLVISGAILAVWR